MAYHIYLAEDDESIRELIRYALTSAGYQVSVFENGEDIMSRAAEQPPDLFLLDIMLPGLSGYDVIKYIRSHERLKHAPVIFITAKGTEIDKVQGFDLGADDYIVEPFGVLELLARVKAVLKRGQGKIHEDTDELKHKDLLLDLKSREVSKSGAKIELTYKEFEVLLCLMENRGRVLTREQLLEKIWGYDYIGETRTVDMHIKTLRQKLGDNTQNPEYIVTVRGVGYKMENE